MKLTRGVKIFIGIIFIVLILAIYFTFIYVLKCDDLACWQNEMKECDNAKYSVDNGEIVWEYNLLGKKEINGEKKCIVEVSVKEITKGPVRNAVLNGKSMECAMPYGVYVDSPESNIALCHGELKEAMQDLIINQLYQYIVDNIGDIEEDILKPEIFS